MSWKAIEHMIKSGKYHGIDKPLELLQFFRKRGYEVNKKRGLGSHYLVGKTINGIWVTVSVKTSAPISVGLLKDILKDAKIIK